MVGEASGYILDGKILRFWEHIWKKLETHEVYNIVLLVHDFNQTGPVLYRERRNNSGMVWID